MQLDWQNLTALGMVAGAVAYLARQVYRLGSGSPGRGCSSGCASCPQAASNPSTTVVEIDLSIDKSHDRK
jgi:hypothetical protein